MAMAYMSNSTGNSRITNTAIPVYNDKNHTYDVTNPVNQTKTLHYPPLKFGLSLRYQFDERWSLESGLLYTRLLSEITTTQNNQTTITQQRLNYIGLPINIGYQLLTGHQIGLYLTTGGSINKDLNASDWLFSLNGAAGAEYRLSNRLSIYAEPGIGYYLPNGSDVSTIYTDRPLNFNLSLGLRFNLK